MARATLTIPRRTIPPGRCAAGCSAGWPGSTSRSGRSISTIPTPRQELLLLSPSVLVPRLTHGGVAVWDTLAIAEYLNEIAPEADLLPARRAARAHCRAISGEIHSGFYNLRSALPMNLKARHRSFKIFSGARPDIERISTIWTECLEPLRRAVPLRRAQRGGRDVRPGLHPLPHLRRRRSTPTLAGLLRDDLRLAADAGMDRGGARRTGRDHRARSRVLGPGSRSRFCR